MKKTKSQKSQKRIALKDLRARKEIKGGARGKFEEQSDSSSTSST